MGGSIEFEPMNSKQAKDDDGKPFTYPGYDRVVFNYAGRSTKIEALAFIALAEELLKNKEVQKHLGLKGGLF